MRKLFLYYIFDTLSKRPFYKQGGGVLLGDANTYLKPDGQLANLIADPNDWQGYLVKYARNIKYWGAFRDMTIPIEFIKDGRDIIREIMWGGKGVESEATFVIHKLDQALLPYQYKKWYVGELNFAKLKQNNDVFSLEVLEAGLIKYLKANESMVYDIKIKDYDFKTVYLDGMEFEFSRTYSFYEQTFPATASAYYAGLVETAYEGMPTDIIYKDQQLGVTLAKPNDSFLLRNATGEVKAYRIKGRIKGIGKQANAAVLLQVAIHNNIHPNTPPGTIETYTTILNTTVGNNVAFDSGNFDIAFSVPAGYDVFFRLAGGHASQNGLAAYTITEGEFTLHYDYRYPATTNPGLYAIDLLKALVEKMTDGRFSAYSDWLTNKKDIVITSGDGLRNFLNPSIKTSLTEFFKSHFANWGIGLSVRNNVLHIEPLEDHFNSNVILKLGQVSDINLEVAEDILCNSINAGYKEQKYQDVNGREEVNMGQKWSLPLTKIVKELDLISDYRADPIGIELTRTNFNNKETTDSSADNETFFINVQEADVKIKGAVQFLGIPVQFPGIQLTGFEAQANTLVRGVRVAVSGSGSNNYIFTITGSSVNAIGLYLETLELPTAEAAGPQVTLTTINRHTLKRLAYTSLVGVLKPASVFNVELRPKNSILNNAPLIAAICDLQDSAFIKLNSADRNTELETTIAGFTLKEKDPILVSDLGPPLFRPYYITFTTKYPLNVTDLIDADPYGLVEFENKDGDIFTGFLFDGSVNPADKDSQKWKLLSGPNNNLKKLQ